MKRTFLLVAVTALTLIPLTALAHDFAGTGDCDSWNLVLDGDYGAHHIYVDGVDVGLDLTPEIVDTSTATSRSFTVFWDKASNDVTVTHTLYRNLEQCQPTTTTTQPEPTTTTTLPPTTTTTQPEVTTTTQTTTTQPEETTTTGQVTTTQPPTTTNPPTTTTPPVTTTTAPPVEELPFTGFDPTLALAAVLVLISLGAGMLRLSRR